MTQDHHPEQLTADEVAIFRTDALLDAIIDGRPWTVEDDLRFLLAGPFGVDWRAGHPPTEAPATSWEPTVLELGHAVAEAMHLDPLWADDPGRLRLRRQASHSDHHRLPTHQHEP